MVQHSNGQNKNTADSDKNRDWQNST